MHFMINAGSRSAVYSSITFIPVVMKFFPSSLYFDVGIHVTPRWLPPCGMLCRQSLDSWWWQLFNVTWVLNKRFDESDTQKLKAKHKDIKALNYYPVVRGSYQWQRLQLSSTNIGKPMQKEFPYHLLVPEIVAQSLMTCQVVFDVGKLVKIKM